MPRSARMTLLGLVALAVLGTASTAQADETVGPITYSTGHPMYVCVTLPNPPSHGPICITNY